MVTINIDPPQPVDGMRFGSHLAMSRCGRILAVGSDGLWSKDHNVFQIDLYELHGEERVKHLQQITVKLPTIFPVTEVGGMALSEHGSTLVVSVGGNIITYSNFTQSTTWNVRQFYSLVKPWSRIRNWKVSCNTNGTICTATPTCLFRTESGSGPMLSLFKKSNWEVKSRETTYFPMAGSSASEELDTCLSDNGKTLLHQSIVGRGTGEGRRRISTSRRDGGGEWLYDQSCNVPSGDPWPGRSGPGIALSGNGKVAYALDTGPALFKMKVSRQKTTARIRCTLPTYAYTGMLGCSVDGRFVFLGYTAPKGGSFTNNILYGEIDEQDPEATPFKTLTSFPGYSGSKQEFVVDRNGATIVVSDRHHGVEGHQYGRVHLHLTNRL